MKIILEIRAAEGGDDSKLLVQDQFALYFNEWDRSVAATPVIVNPLRSKKLNARAI